MINDRGGVNGRRVNLISLDNAFSPPKALEQAIEEQVDFMVIAGDLYDGDWRDYQTGLFFVKQIGRLAEAGIQVFLLYGNHDAESQITRRLKLTTPGRRWRASCRSPRTTALSRPIRVSEAAVFTWQTAETRFSLSKTLLPSSRSRPARSSWR